VIEQVGKIAHRPSTWPRRRGSASAIPLAFGGAPAMLGRMRRLLKVLFLLGAMFAVAWMWGLHNARADPIVRTTRIALPDWPRGAPPLRVVLISDIHIGNSAMDGARLSRIVAQINALKPDMVLIAGDFVYGHDPVAARGYAEELVAPLSGLRAPFGVVATFGNHDEWTSPPQIDAALARAHVTVLHNEAIARGPLAIAGIGDAYSGHADPFATGVALNGVSGARIALSHSPDLAPHLPTGIGLFLAGHTHCGQGVFPIIGPLTKVSTDRYLCGIVHDGARTTIVTGGLGTSAVPLRFGAPPDLWLISLGPKASSARVELASKSASGPRY
jgi:predicted MPP superfamily phosphohydrolase